MQVKETARTEPGGGGGGVERYSACCSDGKTAVVCCMVCFVVKSDIINLRENCPADAVDGCQPSLGIDRAKKRGDRSLAVENVCSHFD